MASNLNRPLLVWYVLLLSTSLIGVSKVAAYTQTDLYGLMNYLFAKYKPEVRPTTEGDATEVYVALYLLSIQDLNEISQVLETSVILEADWVDDYLSWNSTEYGNITYFLYPQEKVWLPDVIVENSVESQKQMGYDENKVKIDSRGLVTWKPSQVVKTSCDIDVTYYPFDRQTCKIIISTWMSTKEDIDIDPDKDFNGVILNRYSESGTWELLSNSMELLPNDLDTTRIQFTLKLKRLTTFYIMNIILPVLFLSFTASMVFFLPADAGEKIGMGITILLAYAVYLTIIADNMPQTSLQVSYLAVYLTLMLGINAMGVVFATIVLHLHHKPEEVSIGQCTVNSTRALRRLFCISSPKQWEEVAPQENSYNLPRMGSSYSNPSRKHSRSAVGPHNGRGHYTPPSYREIEEEITWPKVAETMDRVLFFVMTFSIVIITVVILTILATGDS